MVIDCLQFGVPSLEQHFPLTVACSCTVKRNRSVAPLSGYEERRQLVVKQDEGAVRAVVGGCSDGGERLLLLYSFLRR